MKMLFILTLLALNVCFVFSMEGCFSGNLTDIDTSSSSGSYSGNLVANTETTSDETREYIEETLNG